MNIDPDKVRTVIGPGGKTINRIVDETGVKIDISEDIPWSGKHIQRRSEASRSCSPRNRASDQRSGSRRSLRRNCNEIMNFGAFIEVLPGKEGLLHISKMAKGRGKRWKT